MERQDLLFESVPVRVYVPGSTQKLGRGLMYFHGGGWTAGDLGMVFRSSLKS